MKVDIAVENDFGEDTIVIEPSDTWNLDMTLALVILPALKEFKEASKDQYPSDMSGTEEWQNILDRMIEGFEIHANPESMLDAEYERAQRGLDLFAKHYRNLWT